MIQIAITPEIEQYANAYLKDLRGLADKPEDRLTRLVNDLNRANLTIEAAYVQQIINNYMDIITAKPNDYITRIASFFTNLNLSRKIRLNITQKDGTNNSVYQAVYVHIVNAMGYDDVREKIFPKYMKNLNIKSCIYCGTQYAVSVKKVKRVEVKHIFLHIRLTIICPKVSILI